MIDSNYSDDVRALSRGVGNVEDLASTLQKIYDLRYPKAKPRIEIRSKDLNYYAFICSKRYHQFSIPKKSGGEREISAPTYKLKVIQRCLSDLLQCCFTPTHVVTGFVAGRSVVENAKRHVGRRWVYNIDIKDFFPSIDFRRVKTVMELKPFNFGDDVAFLIANICCEKGCLPQGAPTSPVITNIICQRLDRRLTKLAKSHRVTYSRYADDLTFSSFREMPQPSFLASIHEIIQGEGFLLNPDKERLTERTKSLRVTGLVVNEKLNVSKAFKRDIRYWLRTWEKFGKVNAQKDFEKRNLGEHSFALSLLGKIRYYGMVRGNNDHLYLKYLSHYKEIASSEPRCNSEIWQLLDHWKNHGLKNIQSLTKNKFGRDE